MTFHFNIIHDFIITAKLNQYTPKLVFVSVRRKIDQQIRLRKINRICTYCYHVSKIFKSVGRNVNCFAKARLLSNLPNSPDIFYNYTTTQC